LDHNDLHGNHEHYWKNILLRNRYLYTLSLSYCRLGDGSKNMILKYLPQNKNIIYLNLRGNNFSFSEQKDIQEHLESVKRVKSPKIELSDVIIVNKVQVSFLSIMYKTI